MTVRDLIKKTNGFKLPVIGFFGLIFALILVFSRPESPKIEKTVQPVESVYDSAFAGIGVVEPQSEVISLSTELPGIVREIYIKVGDKVKKGDKIFSLDMRAIDADIEIAKEDLSLAKINEQDASSKFASVANLKDSKAISKDEFDSRKYNKELSKIRVNQAKAKLHSLQTNKERLTTYAPIDGEILKVNIRPGEYASVAQNLNPLIIMGDTSILNVRVEFDQEFSTKIKADMKATAYIRGNSKKPIDLKFVRFEPFVSPKENLITAGQRVDTRVLKIIYSLPEATEDIFVGQEMDVFIQNKDLGIIK